MYNPSLFILAFFICCKIQHLGNFADWHRKHIQYTQYCHRKQILFTHSNGNKSVACMNTMRNFGSQLHIQWITWYNIIKKLYIHETSVKGDNYIWSCRDSILCSFKFDLSRISINTGPSLKCMLTGCNELTKCVCVGTIIELLTIFLMLLNAYLNFNKTTVKAKYFSTLSL